jgi:crotonobetainyl-CoA:carnitine CoA-transferase CaiB-like acyl-CoA transferase
MDFQAARYTYAGEVAGPEGNHHPTLVPMGCFRSADGYVNIAGPSGRLLHRFCSVIGLPDLVEDPRFDSAAARSVNREALNSLIASRLLTRTTAEWVDLLNEAGVPCGPVYRMDEVFADPQVEHLAMSALGILRNPVTMTDGPPTVRAPSPSPGADTDAVLSALGLTADEIDDLRARGVV